MKRETAEWLVCMLLASVGLVYSIWVVPYIPTSDGPQHILSVHIENHYSDPGSLYPEFYRTLPQFAGKGFSLVFAPIESLLPWRAALRVTFSLIAVAFAWGFALVVLALDRERRPVSLLGFLVALPWSLYMGFFPFVVGSTIGLYTLAFVLHRPPSTPARRAVLALLLLVQGISHIFTAILTGVIVAVLAIVSAPKGERLRETGKMAIVAIPAAAILGFTFRERHERVSVQRVVEWFLTERHAEISRWYLPGPGVRGWLVILLVLAGIVMTFQRVRQGRATPTEKALASLAVLFLGLTLFTPVHIPGWQCFAQRFAILSMVLGLVLLRVTGRALVPVVTGCCLASSLVTANLHRQLADGCADALSGLDAPLHFTGPRLPIIIDPHCGAPGPLATSPVPGSSMAMNIPLLYLLDHGGIGTKMFNGAPSIHAVAFQGTKRPPPPDPFAQALALSTWMETDQKRRTSVLTELAADGMPFEGIHVVGGRPSDYSVFTDRGYVTEWMQGSVFIARYEGCPAELLLPADALGHEPVYGEYGFFSHNLLTPEPRAIARFTIGRDTPVVGDAIHIPLPGRPCGPLWLRVVWDADASSTLTPGDRTCEKASWDNRMGGRMLATVTRERTTVTCAPRAVPP